MSADQVLASSTLQDDVRAVGSIAVVDTILEVVCRTTGMGFAAVARVTEEHWIACQVRDEIAFGLRPGGELKVETTICSEVRTTRQGVFIDQVAEDAAYCGHPTPALYGFQSYVSTPIVLKDGTFFGTLCAIDPRPARVSAPETIGMLQLFAELIALHLDAGDRVEVLKQRVAERTAERNLLAEIVGATDVMIMACDLGYTILAINKANADQFERIYGVRPKVGDNMLELLADQPEHQAQVRADGAGASRAKR